ncbi:MAG: sigma-70 family RNA polymerase sigma factor, partial [Planctomycetes bacterium]|nr:sigma-70 family RNA polymerase sigma factor [Planctomycetota bacterium]
MIPPIGKADRLLRRFCRTGDPRALGLLFDHAAPELLRAALWLCGDKSDAEDLLQRTFVTVIEARANYDAGRRAMPWLCGVLGNHARKLHERRERERGHHRRLTVLVQRDDHAAMSPADELAESEVVERIAMLRSELGSPYREVLDLHLGRGLKPAEIAAELGREPATVRTQLVRGLAKLRERVPLSLFSPLVAVALLTDGATGA